MTKQISLVMILMTTTLLSSPVTALPIMPDSAPASPAINLMSVPASTFCR